MIAAPQARFLELAGITDSAGVLAAGTRVETPHGTVVADGRADYVIDAAGVSPGLAGRKRVRPASSAMPTVVYNSDETSLIEALASGGIDAVARGEIGNLAAAKANGGAFAVTDLDTRAETGGFALAADDAAHRRRADRLPGMARRPLCVHAARSATGRGGPVTTPAGDRMHRAGRALPNDVTQGHAADWTITPAALPLQSQVAIPS